MADIIDISKLGVNEHKFKKTSVEFLRADSPMVEMINERIMEGLNAKFKVLKDENGHYRPFLVVEYPELHASVAMYMTSSFDEERMQIDNAIRGEHLFKSPFGLANYISRSAIKGKLSKDKISVIDRERFIFVTNDSFVDQQSQAKAIEEFNISLSRHAANAQSIGALLEKDLPGRNFKDIILRAEPELWVFKKTEHQPIIYNPTAMYLALAINTLQTYKNPKFGLSPNSLMALGEVAAPIVKSYCHYLRYNDKLRELEKRDPEIYKIYQDVRWYHSLTDFMYDAIEDNKERASVSKNSKYKYIYGDPVLEPGASMDERIEFEISRAENQKRLPKRAKARAADVIKGLLENERQVTKQMSAAAEELVSALDLVNEEDRLNLSDLPYCEEFWDNFYLNYNNDYYVRRLGEVTWGRFDDLCDQWREEDNRRKQEARHKQRTEARQRAEGEQKKKFVAARRRELEKKLISNYLELYAPAVKQYMSGSLVPITDNDLGVFEKLFDEAEIETSFGVGSSLAKRFEKEIRGIEKLSPQMKEHLSRALIAEKKIGILLADEKSAKLFGLVAEICEAEQKYSKTNQNKRITAKDRKEIVSSVLSGQPEEELDEYLSQDFNMGEDSTELLMCMQDVYNSKSMMRAYSKIRDQKLGIIDALAELNDPELIAKFNEAQTAIGELSKRGVSLQLREKAKSVEELGEELHALNTTLGAGALDAKEHTKLTEYLNQRTASMRRYVAQAEKLIKARTHYYEVLNQYDESRGEVLDGYLTKIDERVEKYSAEITRKLTEIDPEIFKKEGDEYVERDKAGGELWRGTEQEAKAMLARYAEKFGAVLDPKNYIEVEADKEIFKELHEVVFPSGDKIAEALRRSIGQARTIEEAVNRYKMGEKLVEQLVQDRETMTKLIENEFDYIVQSSEELLECSIRLEEIFNVLAENRGEYYFEDETLEEKWRVWLKNSYISAGEQLGKDLYQERENFRNGLRERAKVLIAGYTPRTEVAPELDGYLTRSSGKTQHFSRTIQMPKSIIGDNGIAKCMGDYSRERWRLGELFNIVMYFAQDEEKNDGDFYKGYKRSELERVRIEVVSQLEEMVWTYLEKHQRQEMDITKQKIIDCARGFALSGDLEKKFFLDPQGLENYMKMVKKNGIRGTVYCDITRPTNATRPRGLGKYEPREGVDYVGFYEVLGKHFNELKEEIKDKPVTNKTCSGPYTEWLEALFILYKERISPTQAQKMVSEFTESLFK